MNCPASGKVGSHCPRPPPPPPLRDFAGPSGHTPSYMQLWTCYDEATRRAGQAICMAGGGGDVATNTPFQQRSLTAGRNMLPASWNG